MSEPVQLAKSAREQLAAALNALQSNAAVPPELEDLAEPIAEVMGILHRVERSGGQDLGGRDTALARVREILNRLQAITTDHPVVDVVMDAVAMSLSKVHALVRLGSRAQGQTGATAPPPAPVLVPPAPPPPPPPPAPELAPAPVVAVVPQRVIEPAPEPAAPAAPPPRVEAPAATAQQRAVEPAPAAVVVPHRVVEPAPAPAPVTAFAAPAPAPPSPEAPPMVPHRVVEPAPAPAAAPPAPARQRVEPAPAPVVAAPAPQRAVEPAPAPAPVPAPAPKPVAQPAAAQPQRVSDPGAPQPRRVSDPAPQPQGPQRPGVPTFEVELSAHSASNFYRGLSGSDVIEHGGIFVATYRLPNIGSTVRLRVHLPGNYEFHASATVQWTREPGGFSDSAEPGFGARITQVAPEARQLINRFIRNREPLFYDDL